MLFEPFAQTRAGREAKEGTGLGLTISRDIARMMRGDITVESKPGRGTTFIVDVALPVAEALADGPAASVVVGLEPGQPSRRVLVTDDVADNRRLLVSLLTSIGFEVRQATNGSEAVETWSRWRPHLIWMDVRMPVMDGIETTREIRRREAERGDEAPPLSTPCVIIALTASAFEHDRAELLAAGCDDFIPKPFRAETLFDTMAEWLGVRFVYETAPAVAAVGRCDAALSLDGLRPEWAASLGRVVMQGDVEGAYAIIDEIDSREPALARKLRHLVRGYRFDEIQRALERAPASHT
jgi:CheY-like chemotaxis protein